jgi:hypothetical protein
MYSFRLSLVPHRILMSFPLKSLGRWVSSAHGQSTRLPTGNIPPGAARADSSPSPLWVLSRRSLKAVDAVESRRPYRTVAIAKGPQGEMIACALRCLRSAIKGGSRIFFLLSGGPRRTPQDEKLKVSFHDALVSAHISACPLLRCPFNNINIEKEQEC